MHKYKKIVQQGFALPTLIIAGTILMIVGVSTLVASTSITKTLQDQHWNRLADEAAQAGVAFASSCLEKNRTNYWTSNLTPGSSCSGGSGGYVTQESGEWNSTFSVDTPASTSGNPTTAAVTGTVNLIAASKTYTSSKTVIINVDQSLTAVGQSTGQDLSLGDGYNYYLSTIGNSTNGANVCIVASDAQAYCAGRNNNGQLGDGTTTDRNIPVKFNLPAGLTAQSVVAISDTHACALASNNQVYCAGNNFNGQLGNGNTTHQSTPVKFNLPVGLSAYRLVSSSNYGSNTCVITYPEYSLYCAGNNASGGLGDGTTTHRSTPVKFGSTDVFLNIMPMIDATVGSPNCAIGVLVGAAKGVYCSGQNSYGQTGNGNTTTPQTKPVGFTLPSGQQALSITHGSGGYNVCVLTSLNNLYCAGVNSYGQLGNGNTTNQSTPVKFNVSGSNSIKVSSTSGSHTCGLIYKGSGVYCAGVNVYGQLGNGNTTNQSTPVKFNIPSNRLAVSVMTGGGYNGTTCALTSEAELYCSGRNNYGQLGNGTTSSGATSTPVKFNIPGNPKVTNFTVSGGRVCALASGQLYCSGRNNYGQLGDGTTTDRSTPVRFQLP